MGQLSRLHQLGLYPGPEGTCEVVLEPGAYETTGAVVLGLGDVGTLGPRALTEAVRVGVLRYVEQRRAAGIEEGAEVGLSFLLLGTGERGIPLDASMRAMLRGVVLANADLMTCEGGYSTAPRLTHVEFVELYRDRAVAASRALIRVCSDGEFTRDRGIRVEPAPIVHDDTGHRRVSLESPSGWWDRLHIELVDGQLRFTQPTSRARAEDSAVQIQTDLVHEFLTQARKIGHTGTQTPGALFELLMSNELKAVIPDRRDTVLVLDDGAAQFPWELLIDRFRGSGQPLSIAAGLIRSLRVDVTPPMETARENKILVVGDPPSHWTELRGAQREASEGRQRVFRHPRRAQALDGDPSDPQGEWRLHRRRVGHERVDGGHLPGATPVGTWHLPGGEARTHRHDPGLDPARGPHGQRQEAASTDALAASRGAADAGGARAGVHQLLSSGPATGGG